VAGTDRSAGSGGHGPQPAIVLVEPQLGENIGMVARAMLNCGLNELRLVNPREPWPNPKAQAAASGADPVLAGARLFAATEDAIADLAHVYATTARSRDMVKPVLTPRRAGAELRAQAARGERTGILFGKEAKGLHNDDVALAEAIVAAPLNPAFSSLNLGMAVLLVAYEWLVAEADPAQGALPIGKDTRPATGAELSGLFGKEAKGLHNDDVALAEAIVAAPLNPAFSSLNLGMAVLLVAYEWLVAEADPAQGALPIGKDTRPATGAELSGLFGHLEGELDACGFLRVAEKRPVMVRNLRNIFVRASLTEQEVRTLRGVIACLVSGPRRKPE
jgi:tRNA/rRNA methyltransferase